MALANREASGKALREFLVNQYKNKKYVVIGDWNDDVDVSIYTPNASPYTGYIQDTNNFFFVTQILSKKSRSSTVSYTQMIDHICLSKSLQSSFTAETNTDVWKVNSYISNYSNTTSDHYPVFCRLKPKNWSSTSTSVSVSKPKLEASIYWNGTHLVVPAAYIKKEFFTLQGKLLNEDNLPNNQIIVYQVTVKGNVYSGTFVK